MPNFFQSDYNRIQSEYEQRCREANASNSSARAEMRKSIEDNLVEGGLEAVIAYEKTLKARWKKARCLAEYDGVSMGFAIARRARERLGETPEMQS